MSSAPIILVPGFWLGAWAWDDVADRLRTAGHDVTALTLPGMDAKEADRSSITFMDHVDAILAALRAAPSPAVLTVHSAAGFSGYAASDIAPELIAHMIYVDTAPGKPPLDPDFTDVEKPLDWDSVSKEENLDGISEEQQATFRERAVPVPGSMLREPYTFTNDARRDVPSTIVATGFSAADYQKYAGEHPEWPFLAGIPELRNLSFVDLPTSHWPMWSKPAELATTIGDIATAAGAKA
jgi:pimeloyl-ACP methyl ester carboxylesterase